MVRVLGEGFFFERSHVFCRLSYFYSLLMTRANWCPTSHDVDSFCAKIDVGNLPLLPLSSYELCENLYLKSQNLIPFVRERSQHFLLFFWPVLDKILYRQRLQQFSELHGFLEIGLFEAKLYLLARIYICTSHLVWFGWNSLRNLQIILSSICEFGEKKLQVKALYSYEC
jgi:hypothetical protein